MLKHISICATVLALGTSSLWAQQREAVLQLVELPGVGFNIIVATPRSPSVTIDLGNAADALVLPLIGGKLALQFEDGEKLVGATNYLRRPACAFETRSKDGKATEQVSVYIVPKDTALPAVRTASLNAQLAPTGMQSVDVPEHEFAIVLASTNPPVVLAPGERPESFTVHSAESGLVASELIMATEADIERMFAPVGLSQLPTCIIYAEHGGSQQAASAYVVPKNDTTHSSQR